MGAESISFTINGSVSSAEILKAFKDQQQDDREQNGHQEGYSGDFQTVREVDNRTSELFDSEDEAMRYCLENAKKWETVVAVRYKQVKRPVGKNEKLIKMQADINKMNTSLHALKATSCLPKEGYITCKACKSRVNASLLLGTTCPLPRCGGSLLPKSAIKRIDSLKARINKKVEARLAAYQKERSKSLARGFDVVTLVAGWGAC